MLTSFSFKNYGPYREETRLDLRAAPAYKEHEYNLAESSMGEKLLKVVAIYGANASGKSQLIRAYQAFSRIVTESFSQVDEQAASVSGDYLAGRNESALARHHNPFKFAPDNEGETEFEATFDEDECEIRYGFSTDGRSVLSEWLYLVKASTRRLSVLFEREGQDIEFGSSIRSECDRYAESISEETLVLSFMSGIALRTPYFRLAKRCVSRTLAFTSISSGLVDDFLEDVALEYANEDKHARLLEFLRAIDVCIEDISVERNGDNVLVFTHHRGADGSDYRVPIAIESEGTKKAIVLFYIMSTVVAADATLLIDELSAALHPLLVRALITQFHREGVKGQIVFTTHDTSMLDRRYLRRDQVWFVDKNGSGSSELYSLADFKLRNDTNYTKGYLSGMFGAIPNLRDFVLGDDESEG